MAGSSDQEKASRKWSGLLAQRAAAGRDGWFYALDHPRLRQHVYDDHLGGLDPFSWVRPRLPCPVPRALEIGCGDGSIALRLMQAGWFEHLDAFDVAEGAIGTARDRAAAAGLGLAFSVRDGNTLTLEAGAYGLIYANHALHHVTDLEHLFAQCAAALRPGGTLFASDYVGPSRMQYSDAHLALMNDMLARLPPEKRGDRFNGLREKRLIQRTPLEEFDKADPSEAPRSAEIIPVLRRFFDVEVTPLGTELTYEVLLGIVHNFDPDDAGDNALMDQLIELDRAAARDGTAEMLFANIVARPRERSVAVPVAASAGGTLPAAALAAAAPTAATPSAATPSAATPSAANPPGPLAGGPPPVVPDFAALLHAAAPRLGLEDVAGIDGWLGAEAADLTVRLCRLQAALGLRTGVLELGVFRGKYLALLAALHAGTGLPLVGVDLFIERIGHPVAAEHVPYMVGLVADAVARTAPASVPPVMLHASTFDLGAGDLLPHCPGGYSFVSVDAGHEADDVANDLALAASVLSPGGIVALDDALSLTLPGVSEGLFRYLGTAGEGRLCAFATCANKLFLCQPGMHATYLAHAAWLLTQGEEAEYLARSAARDQENRRLLFTPRVSGREVVTFDYGAVAPVPGPAGA